MKCRTLLCAVLVLALMLALTGCPAEAPETTAAPATTAAPETTAAPATTAAPDNGPLDMTRVRAEIDSRKVEDFERSDRPTNYVLISVKDFGELVVRLRPDVAPITVSNFQALVARGYYNETTFHRVFPGFMIQGGAGREALLPIKGEFSANGVDNPLLHIRGVLSMARTKVMDSATSQFFLMHADYPSLNGNYAAFGYIVAGLDTVDRICEIELGVNDYQERSVPLTDVIIESAEFVKPR